MTQCWSELRSNLLAETLRYAVQRVPFYKALSDVGTKQLLVLQDFPLLTKADVAAHLWEFVVFDRFPDYMITSGGTDESTPSITFRNIDEYEAAFDFFAGRHRSELIDLATITECTLDIFYNSNGYYWRKPIGWPVLNLPLERPAHAIAIEDLIRRGIRIGSRSIPVRHIQCQNGPLKTLTGYFWATNFWPREFGIRSVLVYGAFLPTIWRQRLEEVWGSNVAAIYGLSELAGGNAMECAHCNSFHYWTAWPEFVSIADCRTTATCGDAMLVLTSLVPFSYVQPRIRYLTGDIVSLTGYCEVAKQEGFRFRGRIESCVVGSEKAPNRVIFSEVEVLEILEEIPDVNCRPHASQGPLWADSNLAFPPFRMGTPLYKIESHQNAGEQRVARVSIEATFDPIHDAARAATIHDKFLEVMQTKFPTVLNELVDSAIALDIEIVAPGSLHVNIKPAA